MPKRSGRLALNLLASPPPQTRGQVASRVSAPLDLFTPRRAQQPEARAVSGRTAFGHNAWETAQETHASRARGTLARTRAADQGPAAYSRSTECNTHRRHGEPVQETHASRARGTVARTNAAGQRPAAYNRSTEWSRDMGTSARDGKRFKRQTRQGLEAPWHTPTARRLFARERLGAARKQHERWEPMRVKGSKHLGTQHVLQRWPSVLLHHPCRSI